MTTSILSLTDVKTFVRHVIYDLDVNFNPDEDFRGYVNLNRQQQKSFTADEATRLNQQLEECFAVCEKEGVEIYAVALPILKRRLRQLKLA